jgi:ABC-type sugar transport system substrate-binding protein
LELLTTQLEQAEKAGIYVIQINMESNYKTDFFVGVDWHEVGRRQAEAMVTFCGTGSGKSGKVLILGGEATAAGNVWQTEGSMDVYKSHPEINIVANQPTGWQAAEASRISTTILQQHKDLCGIQAFWDPLANAAAQAISEAGLKGKVKVVANGEGARFACDMVEKSEVDFYLSYNSMLQGYEMMAIARALLRTGQPAGSYRLASYSFLQEITPATMRREMCWDMPKK